MQPSVMTVRSFAALRMTMRHFPVIKISLLFVFLTFHSHLSLASDISSLMKDARQAFDKKEYNLAGKILLQITRTDPSYRPAYLLLGQVYYYKGRMDKSRRSFEMAKVKSVEPSFAFAWGAAFYDGENWNEAIRGFVISSESLDYRDYSNYYLGVCHFQLKSFYRAKKHLNMARSSRLPARLRKNKRTLIRIIQAKHDRDLQEVISGGDIGRRTGPLSQRSYPELEVENIDTEDAYRFQTPEREQKLEMANAKKDGLEITLTPGIMIQQSNILQENFGIAQSRLDLFAHRENLSTTIAHRSTMIRGFPEEQALGLKLFAGNGESNALETDEKTLVIDQTSGSFRQKEETELFERAALLGIEPYFIFPISSNLFFETSILHHTILPDYEMSIRWGVSSIAANLRYQFGILSAYTEGRFSNQFDYGQNRSFDDTYYAFGVDFDFPYFSINTLGSYLVSSGDVQRATNPYRYVIVDPRLRVPDGYLGYQMIAVGARLNIFAGLADFQFSHKERFTSGNQVITRARSTDSIELASKFLSRTTVGFSYPVFTGINLGVRGFYHSYGDYRYIPESEIQNPIPLAYTLAVEQVGYQWNAEVRILDWLYFQGQYETHTSSYDLSNSLDNSFKAYNPSVASAAGFYLKLQMDF